VAEVSGTDVVSDRDERLFAIVECGLVFEADAVAGVFQFADCFLKARVEVGVFLLEEVVRLVFEELKVKLKDAEPVTEFVRARSCAANRSRARRSISGRSRP